MNSDLDLQATVAALQARVAHLEAQAQTRSKRRLAIAGAVGLVLAGGMAFAASGACPNGFPVCFAADTPALASDINLNFAQLKEWLEVKTGVVTDGGVSSGAISTGSVSTSGNITSGGALTATTGVSGANLTTSGNLTIGGRVISTQSQGNLHLDGTSGVYLGWFSGGTTVFGNAAQAEVARIDGRGFVKDFHRTPSVIVANNCNTGSCTLTCPSGTVVKMAFGFHGLAANGNSGDWLCGGGFQWLGSCPNQTSCTVNAGCGATGIWAECW